MLQFGFGICRSRNFEFQNHIYKYHKSACLIEMCLAEFFVFNFVRLVDWGTTTRGLSQIWLQIRRKNNYFWNPKFFNTLYWWRARTYGLNMVISTFFCPLYMNTFSSKCVQVIVPFYLLPSSKISPQKKPLVPCLHFHFRL